MSLRITFALALAATAASAAPFRPADLEQVHHLHQLTWSADGQTLAFTATPAESLATLLGSRPWVVQPGRPALALPRNSAADHSPSFAPDGRHLVLLSRDARDRDQPWILALDSRTYRPLTVLPQGVRAGPWWSPAGDRIAMVASTPDAASHLVLVTPDHPGQRRLRFSPDVRAAAWSPDGATLAVVAARPEGGLGICRIDPEETHQRWLPLDAPWPEVPRWSPEGTHLLARRAAGTGSELLAWDVSGGTAEVLSLVLGDRAHGAGDWIDRETVVLPVEREGRRHLGAIDRTADGLRFRWLTTQLESVATHPTPGGVAARHGPEGGVAYVRSTPRTPEEVMLWDPRLERPRRLTLVHRGLLEKGLSSVEAATVETEAGPVSVLFTHPSDPDRQPPYPVLWIPEPAGRSPSARFDPLAQVAAGNYVLVVRTPTHPDLGAQWQRMDALLTILRANNLADANPLRVVGPTATLDALWTARNGSSQQTDQNRYTGRMPDHWLRLDGPPSPGIPDRSSLGKLDSWLQKP